MQRRVACLGKVDGEQRVGTPGLFLDGQPVSDDALDGVLVKPSAMGHGKRPV